MFFFPKTDIFLCLPFAGSSGGPVEVIYHLTPIMGLTLGLISLGFEKLWVVIPTSPYFSTIWGSVVTFSILGLGGIIAFSMVWAEFMLIANTSALTFLVAGTFKEIVTVGAAVIFLHERFTVVNALGLVVLILGVVLFNYLKYMKLRQGEIRPVIVEDGRHYGAGGSSFGKVDSLEVLVDDAGYTNGGGASGGRQNYNNGGGSNSLGSSVEMAVSTSRPPSPHLGGQETNNRLRRVFVLQEEEDGSVGVVGGQTTTLHRSQSLRNEDLI